MADEDLSSLDEWGVPFDCGCPPAHFLLPPPPPPPSLGPVCSEAYCALEGGPMGAHFDRAAFPSLPIVAVCSSVVLVAVLVASFLLWRHKTKVQNLLPCKHDQQGQLGELSAANGVTYEDILINHHPTRLPQGHPLAGAPALMPMELLDVKLGDIGPPQMSTLQQQTSYFPSREGGKLFLGKPFNPVYEEVARELSGTHAKNYESDLEEVGKLAGRSLTSDDDEFGAYPSGEGSGQCSATSSVRGSTGGDLYKDPVSSDEGTAEDCDFVVNNLTDMLHGGNAYRKHPSRSTNYPDRTAYNAHSKQSAPRAHSAQWMGQDMPPENIYSTIDEVEDHPHSASRPQCRGPAMAKGAPAQRNRSIPLLSHRSPEDSVGSYGDMRPAFNVASYT